MSSWLSKLAGYAPSIVGAITSGGATLPLLVGQVVKDITGKEVTTHAEAEAAILAATPDQMLAFKVADQNFALAMRKEDTATLGITNKTIQIESGSTDWFVRRWRPFFGYCVAISWITQMSGITFVFCYVAITSPVDLVGLVGQLGLLAGALTGMWGLALTVLGLSVHQRSKDKANGVADPKVASTGSSILTKLKAKVGA